MRGEEGFSAGSPDADEDSVGSDQLLCSVVYSEQSANDLCGGRGENVQLSSTIVL